MTWKIKAITGPFAGQEILIDQDKTIGRDASVDIVLQGGHISRRHAALLLKGDALWIKDLNSSNGTQVNGVRVTEQQLQANDEIAIDVMAFVVLRTLTQSLQPPVAEPVVFNEQGQPTMVNMPKPAPIAPTVQPATHAPVPDPVQQPVVPSQGIKNTLPTAIAMAILILLIILAVWHFIGQ